jgi:hypothetical protein
MGMKQTAIEWIYDEVSLFEIGESNFKNLYQIVLEAMQIEKEQIKKAYEAGCTGELFELKCNESAESYFNKTYGEIE